MVATHLPNANVCYYSKSQHFYRVCTNNLWRLKWREVHNALVPSDKDQRCFHVSYIFIAFGVKHVRSTISLNDSINCMHSFDVLLFYFNATVAIWSSFWQDVTIQQFRAKIDWNRSKYPKFIVVTKTADDGDNDRNAHTDNVSGIDTMVFFDLNNV